MREFVTPADGFITATAPASLEPYRENEFYASEEEFVFAIAAAMRTEYEAIAQAGFVLQVDDAWLPALWDRIGIAMGLEAFRRSCMLRVEALNHALSGIPEEQIRYHLCWGSWHGPHAYDLEMIHIVDIMLAVKAQGYLFEAANARQFSQALRVEAQRLGVRWHFNTDVLRIEPGSSPAVHVAAGEPVRVDAVLVCAGKGAAPLDGTPLQGGFGTEGVELARAPLDSDSILINRRRFILHPRGVKFNSAAVAGDSPTNAELENGANWTRVFENKNVRIVAVEHNN